MAGTYFSCSSIRILKLNEKRKLLSNAVASAMTTTPPPAAAAMSYGINIMYATAAASTLAIAQFSHPNNECRTRVQACVRSRGAYLILSAFI